VSRDVVAGMDPMSDDRFPDEVPPHWSLDFWVADADAIADRAAELGGKVIVPPIRHADLQDRCAGRPVGAEPSVTKVPGTWAQTLDDALRT
jgi:hypothetical protein